MPVCKFLCCLSNICFVISVYFVVIKSLQESNEFTKLEYLYI